MGPLKQCVCNLGPTSGYITQKNHQPAQQQEPGVDISWRLCIPYFWSQSYRFVIFRYTVIPIHNLATCENHEKITKHHYIKPKHTIKRQGYEPNPGRKEWQVHRGSHRTWQSNGCSLAVLSWSHHPALKNMVIFIWDH